MYDYIIENNEHETNEVIKIFIKGTAKRQSIRNFENIESTIAKTTIVNIFQADIAQIIFSCS